MLSEKSAAIPEYIASSLCRLQWSRVDRLDLVDELKAQMPSGCWLRTIQLCATKRPDLLTELGHARLTRLIDGQFQLWDHWPRPIGRIVEQWIGVRLFLGQAHVFSATANSSFNTIVCSQLGRDKSRIHHWPELLDWAIRKSIFDEAEILVVDGTTLFESTIQLAQAAGAALVHLVLPKEAPDPRNEAASWLDKTLTSCGASLECRDYSVLRQIWISPEIKYSLHRFEIDEFDEFPIQDRAAIALADRVLCISLKPGGKVAGLLEKRLDCDDFATASVFIAIPQFISMPSQDLSSFPTWLDRGAVGYVVMVDDSRQLLDCGRCRQLLPATTQVCCPLQKWLQQDLGQWHFLTHCTRGNSGPIPQESTAGFYRRIWNAGHVSPADPFVALQQIIRERRVRGSNRLTRGHLPMVSLSRVELPELLSRRRYRNHLGRWDWEPYGLLFDQRSLTQARPVIYADQKQHAMLSVDDQPYFQPADTNTDWSQEQEWRVAGDIDLRNLPAESVTVFTKFRTEAQQLAAHSPFPVIWLAE